MWDVATVGWSNRTGGPGSLLREFGSQDQNAGNEPSWLASKGDYILNIEQSGLGRAMCRSNLHLSERTERPG